MTLELHATPQEVMRAVEALQEFGEARQVPEKALFGLTLALEECASNIVNHALRGDAGKKFVVRIEKTPKAITLEFRDPGPAFDPTQAKARAKLVTDDQPGGWGLQLVRRYIDEIRYSREADENVLHLTKRVNESPSEMI